MAYVLLPQGHACSSDHPWEGNYWPAGKKVAHITYVTLDTYGMGRRIRPESGPPGRAGRFLPGELAWWPRGEQSAPSFLFAAPADSVRLCVPGPLTRICALGRAVPKVPKAPAPQARPDLLSLLSLWHLGPHVNSARDHNKPSLDSRCIRAPSWGADQEVLIRHLRSCLSCPCGRPARTGPQGNRI